ncbi:MAG: hypothetical protein IJ604_08145 [Prevotella sp.]|nr:hypothetical protein [Prevotella sp.]
MKKSLLFFACMLFAANVMAQADKPFVGKYVNEDLKIFIVINFHDKNVTVPGQEVFGDVDGYMGSTQCAHVWPIVSSETDGNTAHIEMINNYGSEDFEATMTLNADGTISFKHLDGSTLKFPVNNKWQKIPTKVVFKKKEALQK